MRKCTIVLFFILFCAVQFSLFALGQREVTTKHNVYGSFGFTDEGGVTIGAGYEGALNDYVSLGAYAGLLYADGLGPEELGVELLFKPRVYFNSALERFFIGANLGLLIYDGYDDSGIEYNYYGNSISSGTSTLFDGIMGLNFGYKFVFGDDSAGFSLEPSIGYDFLPDPGWVHFRVAFGYAFGGNAAPVVARPVVPSRNAETGTYLGIIGFNDDLFIEPLGIINSGNAYRYKDWL